MQNPMISVIMPVYNTKVEYLKEAIDSVLNQTYKDFELIIVDDGSTEPAVKKTIMGYDDSRIKYFYKDNSGVANSLNFGLTKAVGEYIARMDSDDIALPDRFKKEVEFLEAHPDISIVGGNMEIFNETGTIRITQMPAEPRLLDFLKENSLQHSTVMWRKEDFDKLHLEYDPNYAAEDYALWVKVAMFGLKLWNIQEVLLKYRVSNEQVTVAKVAVIVQSAQKIQEDLLNLLSSDDTVRQNLRDLVFGCKNKKFLFPRFIGKIICLFIPNRKNRQRFRKNHLKPKKEKK